MDSIALILALGGAFMYAYVQNDTGVIWAASCAVWVVIAMSRNRSK